MSAPLLVLKLSGIYLTAPYALRTVRGLNRRSLLVAREALIERVALAWAAVYRLQPPTIE